MKNIPLVDLRGQYEPLKEEVMAAMAGVLDGMKLFLGENVFQLERDFARLCGARHAIGVGSGTDAHLPGPAGARHRPRRRGDHRAQQLHRLRRRRRHDRRHARLRRYRRGHLHAGPGEAGGGDNAEAQGDHARAPLRPARRHGGDQAASPASTACPSSRTPASPTAQSTAASAPAPWATRPPSASTTRRTSALTAKAGLWSPTTGPIATKVQLLRNHGSSSRYHHSMLGMNSRLDELQAAILNIKLRYLESGNISAARWPASTTSGWPADPGVVTPVERAGDDARLPPLRGPRAAPGRDAGVADKHGVGAAIHYPVPIHLQEATRHLGYKRRRLPGRGASGGRDHLAADLPGAGNRRSELHLPDNR